MLTTLRYNNPANHRKYLLEYGCDLFGEYTVEIRYGIRLGISKVYVFTSQTKLLQKVDEIKLKRHSSGYILC